MINVIIQERARLVEHCIPALTDGCPAPNIQIHTVCHIQIHRYMVCCTQIHKMCCTRNDICHNFYPTEVFGAKIYTKTRKLA